ncbi:ankyrin repeat domain-containing protein SOWAHA-like [Leuresthes tenuis]|uniref:ankyrin repeat domain-containing protein SOWAHA-like n=1 Tax=Leuresthes tenuis TaxID=355514 RepID=UPI003B50DFE1
MREGDGDIYDREDAESSEDSSSSSQVRQRPSMVGRIGSQLRSRMCRSLGADLDQLLQEEARGGGTEAARLDRLHCISSSLSLHYNLSTSSLSSCATPPRCTSPAHVVDGEEREPRRSHHSTGHHGDQSPVPLEPREHAWMVKGAAGAWPDIYSLFREDASLLNRKDFISGFTVLHWIAKHGDHRVLNTLWYGVERAGLSFDINAKSTGGQTPLHIAATYGNKNIMRLLVTKFGANVKLRDVAGKRPWQYLSHSSSEVLQLLGAPAKAAGTKEGRVEGGGSSWQPSPRRRHRRHHFSSASGQRPLTVAGTTKVKRSSSLAAFLKHKSLQRFYGHQSDHSL